MDSLFLFSGNPKKDFLSWIDKLSLKDNIAIKIVIIVPTHDNSDMLKIK